MGIAAVFTLFYMGRVSLSRLPAKPDLQVCSSGKGGSSVRETIMKKMDLDVAVAKLKLLKAKHLSQIPDSISRNPVNIYWEVEQQSLVNVGDLIEVDGTVSVSSLDRHKLDQSLLILLLSVN